MSLFKVAKKVVFKINGVDAIELKNVDLNSLATTIENNEGYKIEITERVKNTADNSITFKFSVNEDWDILENTNSVLTTFILRGFKVS